MCSAILCPKPWRSDHPEKLKSLFLEKFMKKEKPEEQEKKNKQQGATPEGVESEGKPFVGLTFDEFDALEKQIESLKSEVDEKTDQWLRSRADFENYKKRVLRDATRTKQDAMINILKIFLEISDDLERALKHSPKDKNAQGWVDGIGLIYQKLLNKMKNQGVERMEVNPGDEFDPNIHEAITQEDHPDYEDGQIIEVLQPGYKISDRIIRPAMVRVSK
jgi:molecular chaperone GrpE